MSGSLVPEFRLTFDGETPCPVCKVIICAACQGLHRDCKGAHAKGCPEFRLTFDGETPCPVCKVIICAACQGLHRDCKGAHAKGCPFTLSPEVTSGRYAVS
jgi:hypothetical protein